jgi:hypothetical protein
VAPLTPGLEFLERHLLHQTASIVWGTVMARREAYDRANLFDARFGCISDVDMWMRLCEEWDVAYVRKPLITLDQGGSRYSGVPIERLLLTKRLQKECIRRLYGRDVSRFKRETRVHGRVFRKAFLRRMAGRIAHADWRSVARGLGLAREFLGLGGLRVRGDD